MSARSGSRKSTLDDIVHSASYRNTGSWSGDDGGSHDGGGRGGSNQPPKRHPFLYGFAAFFAIIIAVLVILPVVTSYVTGRAWFDSLGYAQIFDVGWATRWGLFFAFSLGFLAFMAINLAVYRFIWRQAKDSLRGFITLATACAAFSIAILYGAIGSGHWDEYLLFAHAQPAGITDPVFGQDITFYMLQLPFLHSLADFAILAALFGLAFAVSAHLLTEADSTSSGLAKGLPRAAWAHIAAATALLLALFGLGQWLGRYDYVFSHGALVWGAGYSDIHVSIPWQEHALEAGFVLALLTLAGIFVKRSGATAALAGFSLLAFILYWFVGGTVAFSVQNFQVKPSEYNLEKPYLQRQIAFTQAAYGLDKLTTQPYAVATPQASGASSGSASQVSLTDPRLWDWPQLQEVYLQRQALRPYYTFPDVDIDRYTIAGLYQQVELAAREIDPSQLADQAKTWVNEKLVYTHGYGLVASPVDASTADGYPTYIASNIPTEGSLSVTQPDIYVGEGMSGYVLAPSTAAEFDHPSSAGDATSQYTGTHAPLVSQNRFLWAASTWDLNILISPQITPQTRILIDRDPLARAKRLMPYLTYDSDPYLVDDNGHLYWIIDAYATNTHYPYSEGSPNYIRNSVKVVIDAYEGTTDFYIIDPTDPIVETLANIYPSAFKPISSMPQSLQAHLRYPEYLFDLQASMLLTYHVSDPQVFYNRGDVWAIPQIQNGVNNVQPMVPYYVMATLPGQTKPEFLMILPLTPQGRSNVVAWMVARMDPGVYGQLDTFILPKDQNIDGPGQVSAQIQQNPAISTSFTLLDQHGSQVVLGNLLAFPTSQGFLYIQPVYLRAVSGASQPQLIKVILDLNGQVIYADNLASGLATLTGQPQPTPGGTAPPAGTTLADLIAQAVSLDAAAQAALKSGDPVAYAQDEQKLHLVLQQIAALEKASPAVSPTP